MEKIIKIVSSPFTSPMEIAGNLLINLHAPYSKEEVTIQINPNLLDYAENQKGNGLDIIHMSLTAGTIETKTLKFDFHDSNTHSLDYDDETYTMRLLNIDVEEIQGHASQYFEFLVEWHNSAERIGGSIELEVFPQENQINPVQFILDIGNVQELNSKRISVYINERFSLIFRIFDLDGKEYTLVQELNEHWKADKWHRIVYSWTDKQIRLKLSSGENYNEITEVVDDLSGIRTFHMWEKPPVTIGANLEKKQNSKMQLVAVRIHSSPIL